MVQNICNVIHYETMTTLARKNRHHFSIVFAYNPFCLVNNNRFILNHEYQVENFGDRIFMQNNV